MDGWNRIDAFNILANPYTTTRPAVTLGEREQFTQLEEKFTDDFFLGDVTINTRVGDFNVTSQTSFTYRDLLLIRDATALTASITGGSIGLSEPIYTLDAPLNDATTAKVFTQELRVSGGKPGVRGEAGGPVGFRRLLQPHRPRLRSGSARQRVRSAQRHSNARTPRADRQPLFLRPGVQARSVRALRRNHRLA